MNIEILLQLPDQLRLWHWLTTSYAKHKAFGEKYDSISALADSFAEAYIGKHGRPKISNWVRIVVENSNDHNVVIDAYYNEIKSWDLSKEKDLENIQADLLIELDSLKYLLTLE